MSDLVELEGGCLCGAVRYRAKLKAAGGVYCHCTLCRRASGAPTVVWSSGPVAAFAFTRGTPVRYASTPPAMRQFCGVCGTPLTFAHADRPGEIDVTLATLDDPEAIAPARHIYDADRVHWLQLGDALPRYPGGGGG